MAIWANDPGTLPRMLGPDERARGDELNVYLDGSPVEDAEPESLQGNAPKARALFLGQLPDDQPDDAWADELPDSEGIEPQATIETELVEPVEITRRRADRRRHRPGAARRDRGRAAGRWEGGPSRRAQPAREGSALAHRGRGGCHRHVRGRYRRVRRNAGESR